MNETSHSIGFPTETILEGKVKIVVPKLKAFIKSPSEYAPSKAPVFYNPVMELNRDITVIALQAYQHIVNHELTVCEPLTGCGARGIRFAAEVKGIKEVSINDINKKAYQLANYNVQMNKLCEHVSVHNEDANYLLSCHSAPRKRFDFIDVDPFGSPVPFLDSAIRALRNRGLLALTATDMAPLCGVHSKACLRRYGGKPLRTEYCHELAIRLLTGSLATTAAKHDIGINPLFSHSTDHYIRLYATISYGAKKADDTIKNMGHILHCFNCFHRETVKQLFGHAAECPECGSKMNAAGPLWLGKIADGRFCESMKEEAGRRDFRLAEKIQKMLALIGDEAEAPATYYVVDKLCSALSMPAPPVKMVMTALQKGGFHVYFTHFSTRGIRTDASAMNMRGILQKV
jgi:tRNA (guanine26-N2/guanine27-N2)-dimethyltransferase